MNYRFVRLHQVLIIPFIIIISIATLVTGFFSWNYSEEFAKDFGRQINETTVTNIEKELEQYLSHAHKVNNGLKRVIEHELINIEDTNQTFDYMQDLLLSASDEDIVATLQIGYANGDYLGVSDSTNGVIKKIANESNNNAFQSIQLSDNTILVDKPNYDASQRPWYLDTIGDKAPVWSSVYSMLSTGQLATTLSEPIYSNNGNLIGVIGSDIVLSKLSNHLNDIKPTSHTYLFILDGDDNVIAHSLGFENYDNSNTSNTLNGLVHVSDIEHDLLAESLSFINSKTEKLPLDHQRKEDHSDHDVYDTASLTIEGKSEDYLISYSAFHVGGQSDWHMGVVIPQSDFFGHANQVKSKTLWIWLIAFVVALIIGLIITAFINKSIHKLHHSVKMTKKNGSMYEHESFNIREINDLSIAFSFLSRQFYEMFLDLKNSNSRLESIVDERTKELTEANQELLTLTRLDTLTQVYNRRGFYLVLNDYVEELESQKISSISCFMIDLDFFKHYNDTYGHATGDDCLLNVATVLKDIVEGSGEIGRIGGEEFAVLLPNISLEESKEYADKMLKGVRDLQIPHATSTISSTVTISIGLYYHVSHDISSIDAIMDKADKAMYRAKGNGKNRVEVL